MVSRLACPAVYRKRLFLSFDMRNATHKKKTQTLLANLIDKLRFTVEEAIQMVNEYEKMFRFHWQLFKMQYQRAKKLNFQQPNWQI